MSWGEYPCNVDNWPTPAEASVYVTHVGVGVDAGFSVMLVDNDWYIFENPTEDVFKFNNGTVDLILQATFVNGHNWWQDEEANVCLYYDPDFLWVYSATLKAGYPPNEWYDSDLSEWKGDSFYTYATLPAFFTGSNVFVGGGSLKTAGNTNTITIAAVNPPRWEGAAQYGIYTAAGGAAGTKYVGNPSWEDSIYTMIRSNTATAGKYKYFYNDAEIVWTGAALAYVYGTFGDPDGWWEMSSAPVIGETATLVFTYDVDPPPSGADIVLTWAGWENGDNSGDTSGLYYADIARMI